MRSLKLTLASVILALTTVDSMAATNSKIHTCRIVTGWGTAIGTGSTPLKAKEKAREVCGEKMIDQYYAQRRQIAAEAEDDLILACVNQECE